MASISSDENVPLWIFMFPDQNVTVTVRRKFDPRIKISQVQINLLIYWVSRTFYNIYYIVEKKKKNIK